MNRFTRRLLPTVLATLIPLGLVTGCSEPTAEEHVASAQKMISEGKLESARIELSSALQQAPNLAQARWLLGKVNLDLGDAPGAEKEIRKAIELGYDDDHAQLALVRTLILQNQSAQVIKETNSIDPDIDAADHSVLLGLRAQAFAETGDFEQAEAVAGEALELEPKSVPAMTGMALIHAFQRDYETAHQWLDRALEADPQSAEAWSLLGQVELEQGNAAKAEQALSKAIELRTHPSIEYAKRALARAQLDKFDEASSDLAVLQKAGLGSNPFVKYVAGVNLFRQKKYEEAVQAFEASKKNSSPYLPREYYLASAYLALGRTEQARSQAELISSIAPNSPMTKRLFGAVQISQSELEGATSYLKQAVESSPGDPVLLRMLGYVSLLLGQGANAVGYYEKALELDPDSESTTNSLELARLIAGQKLDEQTASTIGGASGGSDSFTREFFKALALFRDGDLTGTLREAKALIEKYPDNVEPLKLMAACHLAASQWQQARQYLDQALKMKPDDASAVKNLARLDVMDGDAAKARSLLEGLIKAHPTDTEAQVLLARVVEGMEGPAPAITALEQTLERNPEALAVRAELARLYVQNGQPQRVVELTRDLSDKDAAKQPALLERRARALLTSGDADGAQREFKRLLALLPKSPIARFAYADSLASSGKRSEAAAEIKRAIELDPSYFPARAAEIKMLVQARQLDAARTALAKLRQDFGDRAEVLGIEGWFALGTKDYAGAEKSLTASLEKSPQTDVAILLLRAQWAQGEHDTALAGMQEWIDKHPGDLAMLMHQAGAYMGLGRNEEARAVYARVVERYPDFVPALNNLAWLSQDKDLPQAIQYAQHALTLARTDPNVIDTLGMLMLRKGDGHSAVEQLREAVRLAPANAQMRLHLGQALLQQKQRDEAIRVLEGVVKEDPDSEPAREARALLSAAGVDA